MKNKTKFTIEESPPFGDIIQVGRLKKGHDAILICINKGYGWVPVKFLLPHQLYMTDAIKLLKGNGVNEIAIFPVNTKHKVEISSKDLQRTVKPAHITHKRKSKT